MKEPDGSHDEPSKEDILKERCAKLEENPDDFIHWMESTYPELVAKAKEDWRPEKKKFSNQAWHFFRDLLVVRHDELYGRAHVNSDLEEDSKRTALAITIADVWHGVTIVPFLLIALKDLPLGFIVALLAGVGTTKFSNSCGAIAAANQPGKQAWALVGLCGMIAANLFLAVLAGPGTELAMNKSALSAEKANELIKKEILPAYVTGVSRAKEKTLEGDNLQSKCDRNLDLFAKLKRAGDPRAVSLYVEIWGQWGQTEKYWETVSTEQLPLCRKAARIKNQASEELHKAQKNLDRQKEGSSRDGGAVLFLKKEHSDTFSSNFTGDGQIKSGVDSARLAMKSFNTKLSSGDWSSLGLSMFSFGFSVITSGVAVALTIAHSHRSDVAQSFDQKIINARNEFFGSARIGLKKKKQKQQEQQQGDKLTSADLEKLVPYEPKSFFNNGESRH